MEFGERFDGKGFELFINFITRLLKGFVLFKTRKGSIYAGASTFFAILCIFPILQVLVGAISIFTNDFNSAQATVMESLKIAFPNLAPWILKSVDSIVSGQVSGKPFNISTFFIIIWATLGFFGTLSFGINQIIKRKSKGGWIFESFRSFIASTFALSFTLLIIGLKKDSFLYKFVKESIPEGNILVFFEYASSSLLFPISLGIVFFTIVYKKLIPVRWKDSFMGAICFVISFLGIKSFFWIYLHYAKEDLTYSFGNFETLIIALMWIYFINCTYILGACVAYSPIANRETENEESPSDLNLIDRRKNGINEAA